MGFSRTYFFRIIILALALKCLYFLGFQGVKTYGDTSYFERSPKWFEDTTNLYDLERLVIRSDAGFYQDIAKDGYVPTSLGHWKFWNKQKLAEQGRYAFFPALPYSARVLMKATGLRFEIIANFLAFSYSLLAFLLFFWLARIYFENEETAFWATALWMVFPFHYYFSMFYTESLFVILLLGSFLSIHYKKWLPLAILSSLLVGTRTNGIIAGLPFLIYFWEQHLKGKNWGLKMTLPALSFALPMFLTFVAYLFFLETKTGDYFAFSTVQVLWGKEFMLPWKSLFNEGDWMNQIRSFYVLAFVMVALLGAKKLPLSFQVLIWINFILPLLAGSNQSMPRYISTIFPLFFLLGAWLAPLNKKGGGIFMILTLQLITFYYWTIAHPFSY